MYFGVKKYSKEAKLVKKYYHPLIDAYKKGKNTEEFKKLYNAALKENNSYLCYFLDLAFCGFGNQCFLEGSFIDIILKDDKINYFNDIISHTISKYIFAKNASDDIKNIDFAHFFKTSKMIKNMDELNNYILQNGDMFDISKWYYNYSCFEPNNLELFKSSENKMQPTIIAKVLRRCAISPTYNLDENTKKYLHDFVLKKKILMLIWGLLNVIIVMFTQPLCRANKWKHSSINIVMFY